jgi:hypothetical protein
MEADPILYSGGNFFIYTPDGRVGMVVIAVICDLAVYLRSLSLKSANAT